MRILTSSMVFVFVKEKSIKCHKLKLTSLSKLSGYISHSNFRCLLLSEGFPLLLDEKQHKFSVKICIAYLQEGQVLLENNQYVRLRTFTVCLITQNRNPWVKEMVSI